MQESLEKSTAVAEAKNAEANHAAHQVYEIRAQAQLALDDRDATLRATQQQLSKVQEQVQGTMELTRKVDEDRHQLVLQSAQLRMANVADTELRGHLQEIEKVNKDLEATVKAYEQNIMTVGNHANDLNEQGRQAADLLMQADRKSVV